MDTFDHEYTNFFGEGQNGEPHREPVLDENPAPVAETAESPIQEPVFTPPVREPVYTPPAQEPVPQQEPAFYRGSGAGRKESPYANSPYVTNRQPYASQQEHQANYGTYQYPPQYAAPKKPKAKKKKKSGGFWKKAGAVAAAAALVATGCLITAASVNRYWENRSAQTTSQFNQKIRDLQQQIDGLTGKTSGNSTSGSPVAAIGLTPSQVYAKNVSSVVAISSTVQTSYYGLVTEGASTGSGFILTADGYVVTNCHVVEGATSVDVVMHSGESYPAQIVGTDATNDLAVLKVDGQNLPAAVIGSSDALIIGDMVVAIGNPLGELTATQTVGYVSGKDREVTTDGTIISMIQTDAAINPGNSGGPLFNMNGEVVGITTAKYSGTTNSGASIEGIGFAIPIDDVMSIIEDLKEFGYVTGAYLGVTVENTDEESAAMFGLPVGAYVRTVEPGSAADRAGIQPKDIIIDLGGFKVTGITTLTRALRDFDAGDVTTVTVIRSGAQVTLDITLDEKPQSAPATQQPSATPDNGHEGYEGYDDFGGFGGFGDSWIEEYFRRFYGG